jgi:1-deoxyxylulose-5-phosphate synthase
MSIVRERRPLGRTGFHATRLGIGDLADRSVVGISSHAPDVLRVAIDSGRCDVLLFPIGPHVDGRYEAEILSLARSRGIGTVCFKTFAAGKLLGDTEGYQRPLTARSRGKRS